MQEGQVKYILQITGTRAGLLEVNTLKKIEKGQNISDVNSGLPACLQMKC